jgi:pyruvate,orthophosphate dikinase
MQDIEFTVEQGKLWMLQTRNGKRTAKAALKIAVDMAREGLITQEEAVLRVDPARSTSCCTRRSIPRRRAMSSAKGLPASPGAASGKIVFDRRRGREARRRDGRRSSSCASKPAPKTFTACTRPRAS